MPNVLKISILTHCNLAPVIVFAQSHGNRVSSNSYAPSHPSKLLPNAGQLEESSSSSSPSSHRANNLTHRSPQNNAAVLVVVVVV